MSNTPDLLPPPPGNGLPAVTYTLPPPPAWYGADPEPEEPTVPLSHYLWILKRHRYKIAAFVATCVIATFVVSKRVTPIYESTATIDIDRRMPAGILGQEANQAPTSDADQFLATQVRLIQSDSVLRPVAEKFHLRDAAPSSSSSSSSFFNFFSSSPSAAASSAAASSPSKPSRALPSRDREGAVLPTTRAQNAPVTLSQLKVTRPPNTYLLLISYRSPNPDLAADVANAVAASYILHTYDIRFRSSAGLATFMEKQL